MTAQEVKKMSTEQLISADEAIDTRVRAIMDERKMVRDELEKRRLDKYFPGLGS